jgi:hypothetical protein
MSVETFTNEAGNTVSIDTLLAATTIHDYLFGKRADDLSYEARVAVYLECDGFGDTRTGESRDLMVEYMKGGWDWSHVRDSSPAGLSRALNMLVTEVYPDYGRDRGQVS